MTELQTRRVIITGIKIPFFDLTMFMVKWALAAIPAAIVASLLCLLVARILVGLGIPASDIFTW